MREPFDRFEWVEQGVLARASAPHYAGTDATQRMDTQAIDFLRTNQIHAVLSFNQCELGPEEQQHLTEFGIAYLHLPVHDFNVLDLGQLNRAIDFVRLQRTLGRATVVYCGFGHGRTGTFVAAWDIVENRRALKRDDMDEYHVETADQREFLYSLMGDGSSRGEA